MPIETACVILGLLQPEVSEALHIHGDVVGMNRSGNTERTKKMAGEALMTMAHTATLDDVVPTSCMEWTTNPSMSCLPAAPVPTPRSFALAVACRPAAEGPNKDYGLRDHTAGVAR